jgi:glycosyltransferase involved in cell wall biosynthesis
LEKADSIVVHSNYRPAATGGVEVVVMNIIRILDSQGQKILCFYGSESESTSLSCDGVDYVPVPIVLKVMGASFLKLGNYRFLQYCWRARLIIYQEPYPSLWPAIWMLRVIFRRRIIMLVHANPVAPKVIEWIYDCLRALVFNGVVAVATSPVTFRQMRFRRFKKEILIPLSVPSASNEALHTLELPPRYILYFGRIASYKGVEILIDAMTELPEVSLVIAGDGPLADAIEQGIVSKHLKNVCFKRGFASEREKEELIQRCEFVIFPSTSENEAFGLVQLEAMRVGKAIINTRLNSGVNYVAPNDECAVSVDPRDPHELAKAIRRLWFDAGLADRLGRAGFQRFSTLFCESSFARAWHQVVEDQLRD